MKLVIECINGKVIEVDLGKDFNWHDTLTFEIRTPKRYPLIVDWNKHYELEKNNENKDRICK